MPPTNRKQQVAAIIAEKVKQGKAPATTGMPSTKMAKMPKSSLDDFASKPLKGKVGRVTAIKYGMKGKK